MAESKSNETQTETKKTNNKVALRVERIWENAPLPVKPTVDTDAGFDVFAHNLKFLYANYGSNAERKMEGDELEDRFVDTGIFELRPGERCLIGTGLKMTVGPGYEIQVRPRSGCRMTTAASDPR